VRVDNPGKPREEAADQHDDPGPEAVDQITFEGREPSLYEDKKRERRLDPRSLPAKGLLNLRNEESPGVLNIGRGDHTDDAQHELRPSVIRACLCGRKRR